VWKNILTAPLVGTMLVGMTTYCSRQNVSHDDAPMTPPLEMGKAGTIDFIVSHIVSPTECLADIRFSNQTHEPVILRVDTTGYVEGQEVKSAKSFKVTGSQNYTIFMEGSVGFANSFVLEELPIRFHGQADTFEVEWKANKPKAREER
jgi:hypothetical protein